MGLTVRRVPKRTDKLPATVYLDGAPPARAIELKRTPRFLRFVIRGTDWGTLDALDQFEDAPAEGERVIVAELKDEFTYHASGTKNGRRTGWWGRTASYKPMDVQPAADVTHDTARWVLWCEEAAKLEPLWRPKR